jgi:hypothetical protein
MSQNGWISLIALTGWLVLALSSWRAHRVGAGKTLVMATAWLAVFLLITGIFMAIGA